MNKLIQNTVFIFFMLFECLAMAQSSVEAKAILDKVTTTVNSFENIQIEFSYELVNTEADLNQKTKGTILLSGDRYKLNVLGITRLFDGTKLYTISPEDEEITISTGESNDTDTVSPSEMLRFFNSGYDVKMDIVQKIPGRSIQFLKLVPVQKNEDVSYLLLGIDTKTNMVYRLIEIGNENTKTILTVDYYSANKSLSKDALKFDAKAYPGYFLNKLD